MRVQGRYRFIGEDGSLGYQRGRIYTLTLAKPGKRHAVEIVEGGTPCPYSSQASFDRNWELAGQFDTSDDHNTEEAST